MCWKNEKLKRAEEELEKQKDIIYTQWKEQWKDDSESMSGVDVFQDIFNKNYEYVKQKIKHNKTRNFVFKYLMLVVLTLAFLGYGVFFVSNVLERSYKVSVLIESGFVLLLAVLAFNFITKLLDIRKYQETWARHSQHQFEIDMEMLLYVCKMEPYDSENRVEEFRQRVIKIWYGNHKRFVKNMEKKKFPLSRELIFNRSK